MKRRVLILLVACLSLALAFGVTACGEKENEEPVTYSVTYVSGNDAATGTAPTQAALEEGGTFTVAENAFVYAGHEFTGWSDGSKTYQAGDTYTVGTSNVTLTAQWAAAYSVTYAAGNEAATGTAPTQAAVKEGGTFTVAENPFTYEEHWFFGWYDGENVYQPGDSCTVDSAVTLTAVWMKNSENDFFNSYSNKMTFGEETLVWEWIGYNPEIMATFTYTIEGNVMTLTAVPDETEGAETEEPAEPAQYTLTWEDGFLKGVLPGKWSDALALFVGDKVLDEELNGANGSAMSGDFSYNAYMFTDGSAIYKDSSDYSNVLYYFGSYTEDNGIVTLKYGEEEVVFKLWVYTAGGGAMIMIFNDGLAGTYAAQDVTFVLDGYLGATVDGETGSYTVVSDNLVYVINEDSGTAYFVQLGADGAATASVAEVYSPTGAGAPFMQLIYSEGELYLYMSGESPFPTVTATTAGSEENVFTYENYGTTYTLTMSGDTVTVTYMQYDWTQDAEVEKTVTYEKL